MSVLILFISITPDYITTKVTTIPLKKLEMIIWSNNRKNMKNNKKKLPKIKLLLLNSELTILVLLWLNVVLKNWKKWKLLKKYNLIQLSNSISQNLNMSHHQFLKLKMAYSVTLKIKFFTKISNLVSIWTLELLF